jgi:branched-chain amino acid transport system permease protein
LSGLGAQARPHAATIAAAAAGIVLLLLLPAAGLGEYRLYIARLALFGGAMAATWSLLAGVAGQFSFAHVAIGGIAAYSSAIWCRDIGVLVPAFAGPWLGLAVGVGVATVAGTAVGMVVLGLRGAYLALFTLAFGEIARLVVIAEKDFTGGRLSLAVRALPGGAVEHYYLVAGTLLLVLAVTYGTLRSRLGLFLRALREDADAAAAMGVDTTRLKVLVFALTSLLVGLSAGVYYQTTPRLTPDVLNLLEMGFVVVYAVFGGLESPVAGVIGAILLSVLLELLRVIEIGPLRIETGVWRFAVFGAVLVATLRFAPNGFIAPLLAALSRRGPVSQAAAAGWRRSREAQAAAPQAIAAVPLRLQGLAMRFGGHEVFSGVDLVLDRPQICGLIGPNGAGKTTLVNVVTGYYAPTGGAVLLGEERVDGLAPHRLVARGIGRTFQIARSFRRLTVLENLLVPELALHPATPPAAAAARAAAVLAEVGLGHLGGALARSLSGGQQKLLELARLLMLDSSILILDEPFAGVNPALKEEIAALIRRLRDAGRIVLLIEHDLTTVFALCERLVVLANGRVIDDGPPEAVRQNPAVIAAYLGEAAPTAAVAAAEAVPR